jgi:hypothetical protein
VRKIAIPGKKATHQADPRYSLPLEMSAPQEGVGGGTPAPKKDKILSERMVFPTCNVVATTTVLPTAGSRCFNIILGVDAPATRAKEI